MMVFWPGLLVVETDRVMTHFSGWFCRICSKGGYWQCRKWRIENERMVLPLLLLLFGCWVTSALCNPMDCSTSGFPVLHHLPEFAQTHVHWVSDAIQPSHPLSFPFPPAFSLSQHQGFSLMSLLFEFRDTEIQVERLSQLAKTIGCWFCFRCWVLIWEHVKASLGTRNKDFCFKNVKKYYNWEVSGILKLRTPHRKLDT